MCKPDNICSSSSERAPESTTDARQASSLNLYCTIECLFSELYPKFEVQLYDNNRCKIIDHEAWPNKVIEISAQEDFDDLIELIHQRLRNLSLAYSTVRAPESTADARNALTLLFTSQYPNFEFTISDTGDSYILDVKERNGDIAFTQQASELAMLTVLTNNQLVQCYEITETFVTIYRDNMLSLVKDIDALRCKLNKFITMG